MSELKVYKMVGEDYCDDSYCVVPSDVYLKSEADELIAELEEKHKKEVLQIRSAFNSLLRRTRTKRAQLRKEKRAAKHALKNLRVAFADAMRQVWSKEFELCYHENVSSRKAITALTLELFWEKVKTLLKATSQRNLPTTTQPPSRAKENQNG